MIVDRGADAQRVPKLTGRHVHCPHCTTHFVIQEDTPITRGSRGMWHTNYPESRWLYAVGCPVCERTLELQGRTDAEEAKFFTLDQIDEVQMGILGIQTSQFFLWFFVILLSAATILLLYREFSL